MYKWSEISQALGGKYEFKSIKLQVYPSCNLNLIYELTGILNYTHFFPFSVQKEREKNVCFKAITISKDIYGTERLNKP